MKLWLIARTDEGGYDTYDSAVVAADNEEAARTTHPSEYPDAGWPEELETYSSWTLPERVKVKLIGEAKEGTKAGVICASFNAG